MISNLCQRLIKLGKSSRASLAILREVNDSTIHGAIYHRNLSSERDTWPKHKPSPSDSTDLVTTTSPKEIFQNEFSEYFSEGKFINRISYVDYIDQALEKMKDLGLDKDLDAYKELLRIFPPGKYCPKSRWDFGLFHAPQQLAAIRLLNTMESNLVRPDKEVEALVIAAFSKNSAVWQKIARGTYWTMKGRNLDPYPLPEKTPKKTYEIAKLAIMRMLDDPKSIITVTSTSSIPDAKDRTWIVFAQSPMQKSIIEKLDSKTILYIEEFGLTYVRDKYLSYFVLKSCESEEAIKRRMKSKDHTPNYDYNQLKMQFYGKPIREKLQEMNDTYFVDDGHILAIGVTGTSSHDSVLSWLKLLQRRNANLKNLNVVFRLRRPTMDIVNPVEKK